MGCNHAILLPAFVLAVAITPNSSPAQTDYAVVERGADYKVLQKTAAYQNGTNIVHRYTELATGMHYLNGYGQWTEAQEEISILPSGGAAATQGRHQVYFPPDIGAGVLKVVTPDGLVLQCRPLGVTFDDGKNTVFIGVLTNSIGWLTASNQVTYKNCFSGGIKADLVCTYRRGGFECDLVFREQPPAPDVYGLSDTDSTIQLVTEFFNTQDPQQIPSSSDEWFGLLDETLKFGKMTMGHGKAFAAKSSNSQPSSASSLTPVYKSWMHLGERTFLIEQVPLVYLADELDALPLTSKIEKPDDGKMMAINSQRSTLSAAIESLPAIKTTPAKAKQILLASSDMNKQPGVVLDYTEIDAGQTDFTFTNGGTYYISDYLYFGGTTTIENGAVIKYAPGACIDQTDGQIVCPTDPVQPAILTAIDDDSVGETIAGSTGTPSGYYAYLAIAMDNYDSSPFENLRIRYASWGLAPNGDAILVQNCEFVSNDVAILMQSGDLLVGNDLFYDVNTAISSGWQSINVAFITAHNVGTLFDDSYATLNVTNSLFVCVTNWGTSFTGCSNAAVADDAGVFQAAAADSHYLAADSPFRDSGTINVDPDLMAEIQTMTTYAPQSGSSPDSDGSPDLGYHYPVNEDSDHDGLPDWWEWKYFGDFNHSGIDMDGLGYSLLYEYQHGIVPINNSLNYNAPGGVTFANGLKLVIFEPKAVTQIP